MKGQRKSVSCLGKSDKVLDEKQSEQLRKALIDTRIYFDFKARLPSDSTFQKFVVKYKPKEVSAFYIDTEHYSPKRNYKVRQSGWMIEGPGNMFISISEDEFSEFFDIISEGE